MKPFEMGKRKKIQLARSAFNLKELFCKMSASPDIAHAKLEAMLRKKSVTLHGFVELGGLSLIFGWLRRRYAARDATAMVRWLRVLNHDGFPIDTALIGDIGIGSFLKEKLSAFDGGGDADGEAAAVRALSGAIQRKWFEFAKAQQQLRNFAHSNSETRTVRFAERHLFRNEIRRDRDAPTHVAMAPILKKSSRTATALSDAEAVSFEHCDEEATANEYTLEYLDIDDGAALVDDDEEEDEEDEEEEEDVDMDEQPRHRERIAWYRPRSLARNECGAQSRRTAATTEEEQRSRQSRYVESGECTQLDSARVGRAEQGGAVWIRSEYPHWKDIESYRRAHSV